MTDNRDLAKIIESLKGKVSCNKDYRCSNVDLDSICKAKENGWEKYLQCLEERPDDCRMAISFGSAYFCKCPVRYYISKKYRK